MKKRLIAGFSILIFSLLLQEFSLFPHAGKAEVPPYEPSKKLQSEETLADQNLFLVTRVVDGDTIVVLQNGISDKIRLIGVDTPESVDPRRAVECFGTEANAFTKSLIENKMVRLDADPTQGDRDKYGRLLRYVYDKNISINEKIIAEGYGHEYTYRLPYYYQIEFMDAEKRARETQKGLWALGVCATKKL